MERIIFLIMTLSVLLKYEVSSRIGFTEFPFFLIFNAGKATQAV